MVRIESLLLFNPAFQFLSYPVSQTSFFIALPSSSTASPGLLIFSITRFGSLAVYCFMILSGRGYDRSIYLGVLCCSFFRSRAFSSEPAAHCLNRSVFFFLTHIVVSRIFGFGLPDRVDLHSYFWWCSGLPFGSSLCCRLPFLLSPIFLVGLVGTFSGFWI